MSRLGLFCSTSWPHLGHKEHTFSSHGTLAVRFVVSNWLILNLKKNCRHYGYHTFSQTRLCLLESILFFYLGYYHSYEDFSFSLCIFLSEISPIIAHIIRISWEYSTYNFTVKLYVLNSEEKISSLRFVFLPRPFVVSNNWPMSAIL